MNVIDFRNVRRPWMRTPYPFYHEGDYLEEAMYRYYLEHRDTFKRTLIPIFWTTAYLDGINVQPYIDALPKDQSYFAVSQHDDAIKESLPPDTVVFSAGGNSGGIPIPLVCSPMPDVDVFPSKRHKYLASFVGSNTHPIRSKIIELYDNQPGFKIVYKPWAFEIDKASKELFPHVTRLSKFTLCPRGYGAQSFRTYEAMQLGSVPVYVHDDNVWLPFNEIVPWSEFSVLVHEKDLHNLKEILSSISDEQYNHMRARGRYMIDTYFNIPGVCKTIHTLLMK